MAERAEELFLRLQDSSAIVALIGQPEDSHLECKEWPTRDEDAQKVLAKAACGLANADGGVLVIGLKAESTQKDESDVISAEAAVLDTSYVRSKVLSLVSNLVEPGIVGVQTLEINPLPGSRSGFVVIYIPKSDGPPKRSRKDWKFYLRIGSATMPMDYWQVESMFGRGPHPKLNLSLEPKGSPGADFDERIPIRSFVLGIENTGRGIARFPGIRFERAVGLNVDRHGIDGNGGFGLPQRPSESEWVVFRGGIDDVIYPNEKRMICRLNQRGQDFGPADFKNSRQSKTRWVFREITFSCEISSEGVATASLERKLPEAMHITAFPL